MLDDNERQAYEDEINKLKKKIHNYETHAKITAQRGLQTRQANKEKKGKSRYFIKLYKKINQEAVRKQFFSSAQKQLLF